ncbi:MAG TPA: Gfo/Idh/MocA family oxidoreductase [Planctomycetota bacterium]|jgi:predicted dehydrogenase
MGHSTKTRRQFLKAAGAAAAFTIIPRHVLGGPGEKAPSDKLNIACIGLGWPGRKDTDAVAPADNIVALCDVDTSREAEWRKKYPKAQQFQDYRKMFDAMDKGIDAVIVATPDHTHAVLCMAAIKRGKHVYCEKPLAHSIGEVRALMKAAQEKKVITQLGNQGHSSDSIRLFCEWVLDGAIGDVHTVHAGARPVNSGIDRLKEIKQPVPVPANLDWDLWLGPAAERPYHPAYLPETWRGWVPFGNGTMGDWGCHVLDPVFWALDLGAPAVITAEPKNYDPKLQADVFPKGDIITFEFPAKDKRPAVTIKWHSGTEAIPRPKELEPERKPVDTGAVVYGTKGTIMYGSHGAGGVRIIPEQLMKTYKRPEPSIPRVPGGGHEQDWITAIKSGKKAGSDFSYGGPLTEIGLLGVIGLKFPGQRLDWDAANATFNNFTDANQYVNPPYREGWKL